MFKSSVRVFVGRVKDYFERIQKYAILIVTKYVIKRFFELFD